MLSKFARQIIRPNHGSSATSLLTRTLIKQNFVRSFCIPASASKSNEDFAFRSPYSDVDIPNVSLTQYLKEKTKNKDDKTALVSK